MSLAEDLYRLQTLDRAKDSTQRRLGEVESELRDASELEQANKDHSRASVLAQKSVARQTDLELALQSLVGRIAREEDRLYSGAVRNPKELSQLQQEVASLRRRQQKVEDDLLAAMIGSEEADEALAQASATLEATQASHQEKVQRLGGEREALSRRLAEIDDQRAALVPAIGASDLASYEALRRRKGGLAVAQVRNDTCTACGVAVSVNRRWHLREGDLVRCSNCERIIVLA